MQATVPERSIVTAILVNYDLVTPGQKYPALIKKLKAYDGYAHLGGSSWIVSGWRITPVSVRDDLKEVLDDNDTLFTVDISGDTYSGWLSQEIWDWLKGAVAA